MSDYNVYWIHLPEHVDPYTHGYVGVTNNVSKRLNEHRGNNTIVGKAVRKYEDRLQVSGLARDLDQSQALSIEQKYRTQELIGWNICRGGGMPPSRKYKSAQGTKIVLRGEARTDKQKLSIAAHKRLKFACKGCGKLANKVTLARYHKDCVYV